MRHLVVGDPHATPKQSNRRAIWLGKLIRDLKPDKVIVLGDTADMPSLCSYDRGRKSAIGRTYQQDIDAHGDFQEKLWHTVRKGKRRLPSAYTLIGNHEYRIERAVDIQPELDGVVSLEDLQLGKFYDEVVPYEGSTPGSITINGVNYAHYLVSGTSGRPISGERHASSLISKRLSSCVVGHSHLLDVATRTTHNGKRVYGIAAGCYQEHSPSFAGDAAKLWWRGVIVLDNVDKGSFDIRTISLDRIRQEYGRND